MSVLIIAEISLWLLFLVFTNIIMTRIYAFVTHSRLSGYRIMKFHGFCNVEHIRLFCELKITLHRVMTSKI